MSEDEVVALENEAIRAVRTAFEAIELVAAGRLSREDCARELAINASRPTDVWPARPATGCAATPGIATASRT